jgi:mannose-1-phosphate guanylyltransferase
MADQQKFIAVLMAGGRGQRFWPLSTEDRPKQFLDLERCGRSLLQNTYDRVLPLLDDPTDVYVATAEKYVPLIRQQLPELLEANLLIEPVGRDSAPAIALASLEIHQRTGGAITAFLPTDHRIGEPEAFRATMRNAISMARDTRGLVTIGIQPDRPATGYGYIERGGKSGPGHTVERFVEKPTKPKAEQYLATGNYAWNAGMFVWSTEAILSELDAHAPDLMTPLRAAYQNGTIAADFAGLPKISIDYAVMEKTAQAYVVPGDFGWDDIGDWVALERLLGNENTGANTVVGKHVGLEASGNIVYTEDTEDVVVTVGVDNLVIAKRGNVLLLVHKDRIADIKSLLADEELKKLLPES